MKERLVHQTKPTRRLRQLSLLLALLLLPIGVWAENYDLWIGETQVTDANALNVLGNQETPTVVFDATTNTLTLTNATINGDISTTLENLTINLVESNTLNGCITNGQEYTSLSFTGEGSLGITNDEGVFNHVDSYELASGLYLASYSPAPYCDDGSLRAADGNAVTSITISTNETYPVWVYTGDEHTGYTQLTADAPSVNGTSGTANYNGSTLTLTSFECTTTDGGPAFYIGQEVDDLIVNLIGTNAIIMGNGFYFVSNDATLTFTTGQTPGSFQLTDGQMATCNGEVVPSIACENGLRAFYDADKPYQETISTTGTYVKIGDTSFSETGNVTFGEGTAHFDATSNTLTLTDATIGEQGAGTSTDIQVLVDDLTIEISGTNTIYGNITYNGSNYRSSNIQINKASSAESASLTATNVSGFSSCTWGDGLYLSAHDGQGATVDVHYEHYDGEGGAMQSYYGGEIADVTFSTEETNAIWVAGNMSTGGEITGTGITGTVTYNDGVLTLNNASLSTSETIPLIVCNGDLTVELVGSDNTVYFNGGYSTYILKNNGATGTLTFTGEGELNITSAFYEGTYKGLCDGFSTVTFNDNLGLFNRSGSKSIENITGEAPVFDINNAPSGCCYLQANNGLLLNATYHYKITYVDSSIEGHDVEVDLPLDETNYNINNVTLSISDLAGPCTITAYAKMNGNIIGSNKAKLFGSNPSPFRLVCGAEPVDLVLAPAIEEDDGISINGIEANVTYNAETGKISSSTLGSFGGPVSMSASEGKTTILNNYFTMNFEVVPPAPTIVFDETKEYLNTDVVSITMPETLPETLAENAVIMYSWVEDCPDGNGTTYSDNSKVTLTAGTGTLYAWVRYETADDAVYSERVSQVFTVKSNISEAYIPEFTTTATYTGEAIIPEFTVYESEKTMTAIDDDNYTVSYQKSASTHLEDVDAIVEVGTYVITITGTGDTWGGTKTVTREFTVVYPTLNVEFAQGQTWATYYNAEERMDLPEGVNAYVVTDVNETTVSVQAISYVPQGIAVLLEQSTTVPENVVNSMTGINSLLIGTSSATDVSSIVDGTVYVLYNGEFVKSVSGTIPAGRGYLVVSGAVAALGARSLSIVVGDATGISATLMNKETMNKAVYNLQGQRMGSPRRGLNIVDGKKVFIK